MRFLCDEMLGTLSKWLRILGYDTVYAKNMEDEEIITLALNENRILLTRDKSLSFKAAEAYYLDKKDLEAQLDSVIRHFNLNIDSNQILSRCTLCNILVISVEPAMVKNNIPDSVRETHKKFWICPQCNRVYWKGSHWENITQKITELKK
jgi:uncharacterized protein with PIN domain